MNGSGRRNKMLVLNLSRPSLSLLQSKPTIDTFCGCKIKRTWCYHSLTRQTNRIRFMSTDIITRNYVQMEKEALSVVFGCQKFHQYIFGRTVTVESDHKPLESITRKPLLSAPLCLQRLLLAVHKYVFKIE